MAKKRKKRKIRPFAVATLAVLALLIAGGIRWMIYLNNQKAVSKTEEPVAFVVESGSSITSVSKQLEEQGIIRSATDFAVYAKLNKLTALKAGSYELDLSWDTKTILEKLNDPNGATVDTVRVTIIEGDWAKEIARKIAAVTNVEEQELLSLWNDQEYIRSLKSEYPFLTEEMFAQDVRIYMDGYLAPDTYLFYQDTTADAVTRKILDQQNTVFNSLRDKMESSSYSIAQIYTLASIVQYEAGSTEDMGMIAGVFLNRLDIDMPLQSSATVCYAVDLDKENDHWTACEYNGDFDSPYNTYKYKGLPPGPIMNPGKSALEAVLDPIDSDYLYFMADVKTGKVYYAKTLQEHNENCKKYISY